MTTDTYYKSPEYLKWLADLKVGDFVAQSFKSFEGEHWAKRSVTKVTPKTVFVSINEVASQKFDRESGVEAKYRYDSSRIRPIDDVVKATWRRQRLLNELTKLDWKTFSTPELEEAFKAVAIIVTSRKPTPTTETV